MNRNNYYSTIWEYLLLISPPDDINHSIGNIKKEVGIRYGSSHALHSPAHISLVRFLLTKGYEKSLLSRLFSFCINKQPFEVLLGKFDFFPRHTLYIGINENDGIRKLVKNLMFLLFSSINEEHIRPCKSYYITVARNLNPGQFESISNEYKHKQIEMSFKARTIVLLKREYDECNLTSCKWAGNHSFPLGN